MILFNYIFSGCILLVTGKYLRLIKYIIVVTIFFIFYHLTVIKYNIVEFRIFFSMLFMSIPAILIASVIMTEYNSSEILSSLGILRLPKSFIVALTVTLRYIPIFFAEYKIIKSSLKNRAIQVSLKNPLRYFEYLLVPQLFRSVDISRELAIAALTKGIKSENKRSSFYYTGFKTIDYMIFLIYLVIAILIAGKFI